MNILPGSLGISSMLIGVSGENMPAGPNIEVWGGEECGEMDPPKLFMTLDVGV